jgi:hypothetical protein
MTPYPPAMVPASRRLPVLIALAGLVLPLVSCTRPPAGATTVAMDPARAGGFFSMPWPADTRRRADGSIDADGFPGRDLSEAGRVTMASGEAATFGFGTNSAVFFQTTAPVDPASLPGPDASTGRRSPVLLVDLDHPDTPPAPVLAHTEPVATPMRPANLLALLPYPGHPLRGATRYAALVFTGVTDTTGRRLSPSPLLGQLDGPAPAGVDEGGWSRLRADRDDAVGAVRRRSGWHPSEVVAFTTFTTQDTTRDLTAITSAVRASPAPALDLDLPSTPCAPGGARTATGTIALPRWQEGVRPFLATGGAIVIGADGRAVPQGVDPVVVEVTVPCDPVPPGGWPILLFMDGTGASANSRSISQLGSATTPLPYAVFSIAGLFSGDRSVPSPLPSALLFFNYVNPLAGRTNQLQQAADLFELGRAARAAVVRGPGADAGGPAGPIALDAATVVAAGHSQGALTLPITLAADPTIRAGFLSSGGAGFYHAVVHRGDLQDLIRALVPVAPGELDLFHPLVHLLQTFAEIGDAANYAHLVRDADLAIYAGLHDGCSPIESSVHLARALGVPVALPVTRVPLFGSRSLEPPVVAVPVSRNLRGGRTGVLVQLDQGHFGASTAPEIGRSLVESIATGGPARVEASPRPGGGSPSSCARADPPPRP